jgi:hypothetical protein
MTRKIDLTKRLDEDELRYLVDRDMWDALRENARNLDLPEPNLPSARGIRMQVPRKQLRNTDALDRIADQLGVSMSKEGDEPSARVAETPPPPAGPQPTDWNKLTVAQLKEEMDKRRQQYEAEDDQEGVKLMTYAGDARKDDLVSALQLDDEEDEGDN